MPTNRSQPPESLGEGAPSPLRQLIIARALEFLREPAAVFWAYGFPLLMIVALGIAFRTETEEPIVVDIQNGQQAQTLADVLETESRFVVTIQSESAASRRLRVGKTDLVIATTLESEAAPAGLVYSFDPSKPGSELAKRLVDERIQRNAGRSDVVPNRTVAVSEPGGRYIDFLVPGLIGMGIMGGGLWGVGFAVVDLRIRKLMKRFVATPMRRSDFLASVLVSRLLFTIPEALIILLFGRLFFQVVNFGGNLPVLGLIVVGALQFSGIGLLIASRAKKLETVSGLMNLVMIPMWIGSGIFFSTERFPEWTQPVIQWLPLTPLNQAMRGVMLEGLPLWSFGAELGIMAFWTVTSFLLALKWFRWR